MDRHILQVLVQVQSSLWCKLTYMHSWFSCFPSESTIYLKITFNIYFIPQVRKYSVIILEHFSRQLIYLFPKAENLFVYTTVVYYIRSRIFQSLHYILGPERVQRTKKYETKTNLEIQFSVYAKPIETSWTKAYGFFSPLII